MKEEVIIKIEPYYELVISHSGICIYSFFTEKRKLLLYNVTADGYLKIKLDGKYHLLHHLIAKYYIGERPEGDYVIDHIDGNKLNNFPENLQYITRIANIHKSIAQGFHVANHPEKHGNYKNGRSLKNRVPEYKREWYLENKERILLKAKEDYLQKKRDIRQMSLEESE
jgi:hypothetical protein